MLSDIPITVILQNLVMPELDGLTLVKFFRANAAYEALRQSERVLAAQIAAGVKFVQSLLPAPLAEPLRVDWRYVPCADLGGDTFGYHWLDGQRFAVYLVDVSGHGLDSALLSVTIVNVLRSRSLAHADFSEPGQVLSALNEAFQMESYGDKFFTIWYGVYGRADGAPAWSSGGHPPALLFEDGRAPGGKPAFLGGENPMIGAFSGIDYAAERRRVAPGSRLYVYSDGAHEVHKPDDIEWTFEEFKAFMSRPRGPSESVLDQLLGHVRQLKGADSLDEDFSVIEVVF